MCGKPGHGRFSGLYPGFFILSYLFVNDQILITETVKRAAFRSPADIITVIVLIKIHDTAVLVVFLIILKVQTGLTA